MGNLIAIRRRIRSAKNISQITKAMEMVSASKMKKAQDQALQSRPFTDKLREMIAHVASSSSVAGHPLARNSQSPQRALVVMIATNKGLCGALNVNLHKGLLDHLKTLSEGLEVDIVTVGSRARTYTPKRKTTLKATYNDLGETVTFEETRSIANYIMQAFVKNDYDLVHLIYPKFISTLTSTITKEQLLPLSLQTEVGPSKEYSIEPSPKALVTSLLPYAIEMSMFQTILEARASEHSARMVAMKNASDNAKELIENLTLVYNQARQSQVTSELLDVTTARMAIE
jgi:F-type H+-transporting ATPase subunit gamma